MKNIIKKISLFLAFIFLTSGVLAQQSENDKGVGLYEKGDYPAAIAALKATKDSKGLYYLALSYEKVKEPDKAKESLEKCIAETYDVYARRFYNWQKANAQNGEQTLSEFLREVKFDIEIGFLAAKKAQELDSNIFKGKDLAFKAETFRLLILTAQSKDPIYARNGKKIKGFKISEKPRAVYPKDFSGTPLVRRNQSPGVTIKVTLLMVFGDDGEIKLIVPVDPVIDAFTVETWKAAAKIKFNPAAVNDKSVTVYSPIEYSFTIG